jgi:predicted MFS family arabinose efflux permease
MISKKIGVTSFMFKTILPLSMILSFRFLGIFIVLPVLSLYAYNMPEANFFLVGLVIGGYAFTQLLLQTVFGFFSDKFGRKKAILIGLVIFAIGSIICAISNDIYSLITGRLLQGAGAIGAVVSAMIADLVKEEQRSKAMAIMGGSIAISFSIAMIISPIIAGNFGVESLFWLTTILIIISMFVLIFAVPNPPKIEHSYNYQTIFSDIMKNKNLLIMDITNLLQKGLMTATFAIIPIILVKTYGWELVDLYKIYIPSTILGILAMGPSAVLTEKKGKAKLVLNIGIALMTLSYILFNLSSNSETIFLVAVAIFFIGFNIHEPIMQSVTSKFAKVHQKGSALGIFNSFGYFGTMVGGMIGAYAIKDFEINTLTNIITVIGILWIFLIIKMDNPQSQKNIYINENDIDSNNLSKIENIEGVLEWYKNQTEKLIIIKYSDKITNEDTILSKLKG